MIDLSTIKLSDKAETIFLPNLITSQLVDIITLIDPSIKAQGLPKRKHDENGKPLPSWDFYIDKFENKESIIKQVHLDFDSICAFDEKYIMSLTTKVTKDDVIKIASLIENRNHDKIDEDYLANPNDVHSFVIV